MLLLEAKKYDYQSSMFHRRFWGETASRTKAIDTYRAILSGTQEATLVSLYHTKFMLLIPIEVFSSNLHKPQQIA